MTDEPKVVSLKSVSTKKPVDKNTEVMVNFLKDTIRYVEQGGISQINTIIVDKEDNVEFAVVGLCNNPYKTVHLLQNQIPFMYADVCIEPEFEEEY